MKDKAEFICLISVVGEVDAMRRVEFADSSSGEVAVEFFEQQFGGALLVIANPVHHSRRHDDVEFHEQLLYATPVQRDHAHRQPGLEHFHDDLCIGVKNDVQIKIKNVENVKNVTKI